MAVANGFLWPHCQLYLTLEQSWEPELSGGISTDLKPYRRDCLLGVLNALLPPTGGVIYVASAVV